MQAAGVCFFCTMTTCVFVDGKERTHVHKLHANTQTADVRKCAHQLRHPRPSPGHSLHPPHVEVAPQPTRRRRRCGGGRVRPQRALPQPRWRTSCWSSTWPPPSSAPRPCSSRSVARNSVRLNCRLTKLCDGFFFVCFFASHSKNRALNFFGARFGAPTWARFQPGEGVSQQPAQNF